jgi:hypothetical protein
VFGYNYIGRKNDTELRAIRWQREITPAMRSFLFSLGEGEIIVRNCLHGAAPSTERCTESPACLAGFSCPSIILLLHHS